VRYIADLKPEQQIDVAHAVFEAVGDKEAGAGDFGEARQLLYPKPAREPKAAKTTKEAGPAKLTSLETPLQFDTNLVSFAEIKEKLKSLYNIFTNSSKKQEGLNLIGRIQKDLNEWVNWEAKQINGKEVL
jgi:hypothetical protein